MFFIPLSQIESVDLVIHALRVAGGAADCSSCPARQVCMKQCLTIAEGVEKMVRAGTLPSLGSSPEPSPTAGSIAGGKKPSARESRLKVIK
jgi:hypothetical protein